MRTFFKKFLQNAQIWSLESRSRTLSLEYPYRSFWWSLGLVSKFLLGFGLEGYDLGYITATIVQDDWNCKIQVQKFRKKTTF